MKIIPALKMIKEGKVKNKDGEIFPVLEIEVIASEWSDPLNLEFEWVTTTMTPRSVKFKLQFKKAMHVSAEEEPDYLRVIFRDPLMFIGQNNMAISDVNKKKFSRSLQRVNPDEYYETILQPFNEEDVIVLEKELPPQLQLGGTEEAI